MKSLEKMGAANQDPLKIVLLGDEGVGKTALLVRFLCRRYLGEYDPTIEDSYSKKISIDGKTHIIEVLDTADQGEGSSRRKEFMSTANAFIIAFSTIESKSFRSVLRYKSIIEQYSQQNQIPIGLVGTKSDLTHLRQVPRTEAQSFATISGYLYSECSSAYDINVQNIFHNLIRACRGELGLAKNAPDKQIHRKKSIFNKLSSQFMRKRSYSRPVEMPKEIVHNSNGFGRGPIASLTANVTQNARRRSYSVTTMI